VYATRDPHVIKGISSKTSNQPGHFDRDTMPTGGIARATGRDSLLYANGDVWKKQKQLVAPPFAKSTLFQPEIFQGFADAFRATVAKRLELIPSDSGENGGEFTIKLESEIKPVMLEMLVNCFFGARVPYEEIRGEYVPALEHVIDHIVRDTVINRFGVPLQLIPGFSGRVREAKAARQQFERLMDVALEPRRCNRGLWSQFHSEAPDEALRSNIRVFLAGALEATTSYACWALSHLSRYKAMQQCIYDEIQQINEFTPEALAQAESLNCALEETLRLTPSLYFHPRRSTAETTVELPDGETFVIPKGVHILLDVWHANRHEDHWGVEVTGHPALAFEPARWKGCAGSGRFSNKLPHFGFGHGPRFCPGKSLGQLEVALVVGTVIKLFEFEAVNPTCDAKAGVSTKPADGVLVRLRRR
jgi:cytochrome P450